MNATYRAKARQALANNWKTMIIMMIMVSLLATIIPELVYLMMIPSEILNMSEEEYSAMMTMNESQFRANPYVMLMDVLNARVFSLFIQMVMAVFVTSFFWVSLNLVRGEKVNSNQLMGNISSSGGRIFKFTLLYQIYLALWTLLFIIPGVIKYFSYSLAPFILKDNPNMSASEAITRSRVMMDGHKADLFVLHLTFAGWGVLVAVGYAFLNASLVGLSLDSKFAEGLISIILLTICLVPLHVYVKVTIAVFYEKIIADANNTSNSNGTGEESRTQSINLNKTEQNGQGSIIL